MQLYNCKLINMSKRISLLEGLQYRRIPLPCNLTGLQKPFVRQPVGSLTELRVQMGPFFLSGKKVTPQHTEDDRAIKGFFLENYAPILI